MSLLRKSAFRIIDDDGTIYLNDVPSSEALTNNESRKLVLSDTSGNLNRVYYSANFSSSDGNNMIFYSIPDLSGLYDHPNAFGPVIEADAGIAFVESDNNRITTFFDVNNGDIANRGDVRSNGFHIADNFYVSNGTKATWRLGHGMAFGGFENATTTTSGTVIPSPTDDTNISIENKEWRFYQKYQNGTTNIQVGGSTPAYRPKLSMHRSDTSGTVVEDLLFEGTAFYSRSSQSGGSGTGASAQFSALNRVSDIDIAHFGVTAARPDGLFNLIDLECRVKVINESFQNMASSGSAQNLYRASVEIDICFSCIALQYSGSWTSTEHNTTTLKFIGHVLKLNSGYSSFGDTHPIACKIDPNISSTTGFSTHQSWWGNS